MAQNDRDDDWIERTLRTEWSPAFVERMRNRMLVSFTKYGPVREAFGKIDQLASALARIERYKATGNTEWLVDAANFLMIEFMQPEHRQAHFRATDSDESIGRVRWTTGEANAEPNADSAERRWKARQREGD